jgi:hypothetical protein
MSRKYVGRVLAAAAVTVLFLGGAVPARAGVLGWGRTEGPDALLVRIWSHLVNVWQETGILIDPNGAENPQPMPPDQQPPAEGSRADSALPPAT